MAHGIIEELYRFELELSACLKHAMNEMYLNPKTLRDDMKPKLGNTNLGISANFLCCVPMRSLHILLFMGASVASAVKIGCRFSSQSDPLPRAFPYCALVLINHHRTYLSPLFYLCIH